jgi:hypothetical protein
LLERAIGEAPANIENYLKLAELLVADQQLEEAEHVLEKYLTTGGDDSRVQAQLEFVKSARLQQRSDIEIPDVTIEPTKRRRRIPWLAIIVTSAGIALLLKLAPGPRNALLTFALTRLRPVTDFTKAHAWGVALTAQILLLCMFILIRAYRQQAAENEQDHLA